MAYVKRIVCLANSFKLHGRCVAGREMLATGEYGGWIRPVSARPTAEVSLFECEYRDGTYPMLMDIIDVPMRYAAPQNHQTENHVIDIGRWVKRGKLGWGELEELCEEPESIWINRDHTSQGQYDCISPEEAATFRNSLMLIQKKDFTVEVTHRIWDGVRSRTYRGKFDHKGAHYNLSVTDPIVRDVFKDNREGDHQMKDVYLTINLTEPYKDGRCYKLVAAVIRNPPLRA
ncbi:conserved hypothetical protein [Candidatus Sulfopaludibacter sp. SbA4]|nr:conserved hypothetical protein [Candidatus Sulfopaludibacter sp. SbA4]